MSSIWFLIEALLYVSERLWFLGFCLPLFGVMMLRFWLGTILHRFGFYPRPERPRRPRSRYWWKPEYWRWSRLARASRPKQRRRKRPRMISLRATFFFDIAALALVVLFVGELFRRSDTIPHADEEQVQCDWEAGNIWKGVLPWKPILPRGRDPLNAIYNNNRSFWIFPVQMEYAAPKGESIVSVAPEPPPPGETCRFTNHWRYVEARAWLRITTQGAETTTAELLKADPATRRLLRDTERQLARLRSRLIEEQRAAEERRKQTEQADDAEQGARYGKLLVNMDEIAKKRAIDRFLAQLKIDKAKDANRETKYREVASQLAAAGPGEESRKRTRKDLDTEATQAEVALAEERERRVPRPEVLDALTMKIEAIQRVLHPIGSAVEEIEKGIAAKEKLVRDVNARLNTQVKREGSIVVKSVTRVYSLPRPNLANFWPWGRETQLTEKTNGRS